MRNEDLIFEEQIKTGETFLIDTSFDYTDRLNDPDIRRLNTIYSYKYGIEPGFDKELLEYVYTCNCQKLRGQTNVGLRCSFCGSQVIKNEFPVDKFGYIELPFIAPTSHCTHLLSCVMSKGNFEDLLAGKTVFKDIYEDLDDILLAYGKKEKMDDIEFIKNNKDKLFATMVPVISAKLRPFNVSTVGKTDNGLNGMRDRDNKRNETVKRQIKATTKKAFNVVVEKYNTPFTQLSMAVNSYNHAIDHKIYRHCDLVKFHIYRLIHLIYTETINMAFGSKQTIARNGICAVRFPYTSVAVLAPLPEYSEMDSCTIPFETFRAAFQEEIKEYLLEECGVNLLQVNRMTNLNRTISAEEKKLILSAFDFIKDRYIYINRQPTIDWGSIMVLNVKEVRDELVYRIHPLTLTEQRADFDGDAPFMVGLHKDIRADFHKAFSPNANIIKWNLDFNTKFGMINDYQVFAFIAFDDGYGDDDVSQG